MALRRRQRVDGLQRGRVLCPPVARAQQPHVPQVRKHEHWGRAAGGAPPVLVFADLRDVGLLRTSDGGAEYAAALEAVDALPAAQRHDACQVRRCAVQ